jgi:HEAT repeat protein
MMMAKKLFKNQTEQELLYEIMHVLKAGDMDECQKMVEEKLPKLQDKKAACNEIIGLMDSKTEEGGTAREDLEPESRGWIATALSRCGTPDKVARTAIINWLKAEEEAIVRYWMLLALYRIGGRGNIESTVREIANQYIAQVKAGMYQREYELEDESKDEPQDGLEKLDNYRAGPLALAILASWKDRAAAGRLEEMLKSRKFDSMWSVCRALEVVSCREMLEPLQHVAEDLGTWPDIRNKSVKSLGLIESPAAARALGQVLNGSRDAIIKETAIEGLEHLGQSRLVREMLEDLEKAGEAPYSVSDSLMIALLDGNAQIRRRAAEALPKVLIDTKAYDEVNSDAYKKALAQARTPATQKVVKELVRESVDLEKSIPLLVDALRVIDPPEAEIAATALTTYLSSEDVSVKQRAAHALKILGGEKAVQTLMAQKSEVLRAYNDLLAKADEPIQELFKETMLQAQRSFSISQWMSITIFVIGVITLLAGLIVAFNAGQDDIQRIFGAGTSIIGVIAVILDMTFRDPHKRVQEATSILLRIKVIFLGYVRQIHQVDATFKHEFIEGGKNFGIKETKETILQINEVMKKTMDMITRDLPVRKNEKLAVEEVLKPWQERLDAAQQTLDEKVKGFAGGQNKRGEVTVEPKLPDK